LESSTWNLSRKHFRIVVPNGKFVKLNKFRNRVSVEELRDFCLRYAPVHVYFSVLDWLFPERVGKKYKANRAVPLGGEYLFDVGNHNVWVPHNNHVKGRVCNEPSSSFPEKIRYKLRLISAGIKDIETT